MSLQSILDRLAGPAIAIATGFGLLYLGHEELAFVAIGGALGILLPQRASLLLRR